MNHLIKFSLAYMDYEYTMSIKLCKILNLLMEETHLNAEELSRRIGVPASTIKKIRTKNDSNPTLSTLTPLAEYFDLSISQLIGDIPLPKSRIKGSYKVKQDTLSRIPLISWQDAITWPKNLSAQDVTITSEHPYNKHSYALLVEEENWENLAKGTALLIDPTTKMEHRDFIITYKNGQKIPTLKQILFDDEKKYLKPIISGYDIIPYTRDYKILGIVMEYKKYLK